MADRNEFIDSCESVTEIINKNSVSTVHGITRHEVRKIMKDLGFKFKKVKHIAMTANSERSIVLR